LEYWQGVKEHFTSSASVGRFFLEVFSIAVFVRKRVGNKVRRGEKDRLFKHLLNTEINPGLGSSSRPEVKDCDAFVSDPSHHPRPEQNKCWTGARRCARLAVTQKKSPLSTLFE
jgi:hypothetical protein